MQLPILQVMGLASEALGLLNKVLSKPASKGFDALLTQLSLKPEPGKAFLKELLSSLKAKDAEATEKLLASDTGAMIFQLLSALKNAGLNAKDIRTLLSGRGTELSDDALQKMLASVGIPEEKIKIILSDKAFKDELKIQIAEGLKEARGLKTDGHRQKAGIAEAEEGKLRTGDDSAEKAEASAQTGQKAAIDAIINAATADEETLQAVLKGMEGVVLLRGMPEAMTKLKAIVLSAARKVDVKMQAHLDVDIAPGNVHIQREIDISIKTLADTAGIKPEVLEKIFFASEADQRQEAVAEFASKLSAYLKGNKPVNKDLVNALSFVRSATSKVEWAGIEKVIKQWRPDIEVPEGKFALDKGVFKALAQKFTADAGPVFDRFVKGALDQIRFQLPIQMKNGEGTAILRLHPPMLGRVDVSITLEDGKLQATFRAENQLTKDMLQMNIAVLKETLYNQGIRVTQLNVTTGLEYRQQQQNMAYAFLDQGRQSGSPDHQERRSGGSGGNAQEEGGDVYRSDASRDHRYITGVLDLFA